MNRKTYYFRCIDCGRRMPEEQESVKPGICRKCYDRAKDFEDREEEYQHDHHSTRL